MYEFSMESIMCIVLINVHKIDLTKTPLTERIFDSMIETLTGGSLLTRSELLQDNLILQKLGIKESKLLVIHKHCVWNTNIINQGVDNQLLCVSVLNRSGDSTKKNLFLPLFLATNCISWRGNSRPGISNGNCRKVSKVFYNP